MARFLFLLLSSSLTLSLCSGHQQRKNVLFLVADDMRPELSCFLGPDFPAPVHPRLHSPNLDALASRSLLLRRAYVQQALCSPSRTSLLTGRRPDTTHVYDLETYFRKSGGNFTTIPQYFKQHGYRTVGLSKIFHPGQKASGNDDPPSWTDPYWHPPNLAHWSTDAVSWRAVDPETRKEKPLPDEQTAQKALEVLKDLAANSSTTPFFLAVGFVKPHLPFIFPEEFLKLYPSEDVRMPENEHAPRDMPPVAWSGNTEIRWYKDIAALMNFTGKINSTMPRETVLELRRAYYSALSFTDYLIGQILAALKELGLQDETIVSFWGDHGWHLGENDIWAKKTNFELATHAPMMVSIPGVTDGGVVSEELTEYVDLFPTLADAAGLPALPLCPQDSANVTLCREGESLIPLLLLPSDGNVEVHSPRSKDHEISSPKYSSQGISSPRFNGRQQGAWKQRVFSQYPRENSIMGYTMRTHRYRYTEWVRFDHSTFSPDWKDNAGIELYDQELDPEENRNRAGDSAYAEIQAELSAQLRAGWRNALPDAGERNALPDAGERNALPNAGERNALPDAGERNALPDAGERNALPDSGERNALPNAGDVDAGENALPDAVSDDARFNSNQAETRPKTHPTFGDKFIKIAEMKNYKGERMNGVLKPHENIRL